MRGIDALLVTVAHQLVPPYQLDGLGCIACSRLYSFVSSGVESAEATPSFFRRHITPTPQQETLTFTTKRYDCIFSSSICHFYSASHVWAKIATSPVAELPFINRTITSVPPRSWGLCPVPQPRPCCPSPAPTRAAARHEPQVVNVFNDSAIFDDWLGLSHVPTLPVQPAPSNRGLCTRPPLFAGEQPVSFQLRSLRQPHEGPPQPDCLL